MRTKMGTTSMTTNPKEIQPTKKKTKLNNTSSTTPLRHPLPARPITNHHKQDKENQPEIKKQKKPNKFLTVRSMTKKSESDPHKKSESDPKKVTGLPKKPTFYSKPINQVEVPSPNHDPPSQPLKAVNQQNPSEESTEETQVQFAQPLHARTGSIRSLSSSSTLLSPTTRSAAHQRRNLCSNQHERERAIVKVRQAVIEATARKTPLPNHHHRGSVYTPKPLLLPYKLARCHSVNLTNSKRISLRSAVLDQQIDSLSSPAHLIGGERPTHRRQLQSESIIFGHRRTLTESIPSPPSHRILSPRSGGRSERGMSPDFRRSQYDSFYQLLGTEVENDRGTETSSDHRRDSSTSVLLSPVLIESSRSWTTNHMPACNPSSTSTSLALEPNETHNGTPIQQTPIKKLRSYKSDGSILLKSSKLSTHSINNQPILFQKPNLQKEVGKAKAEEEGRLTAMGKLKSILEENEDEMEIRFERVVVDQFLKFKRLVWN